MVSITAIFLIAMIIDGYADLQYYCYRSFILILRLIDFVIVMVVFIISLFFKVYTEGQVRP
jgi:hypothetical protein